MTTGMKVFIEKNRKFIFGLIVLCSFICALAYNILTPYLSDDYAYMMELRDNGAASVVDVAKLAFAEYFQHGGRLLHYFTFRLFLFIPNKMVFNVVSSLYFVALGLLIYANVDRKKKFDMGILLLAFGLVWLLAVSPGQTMFWLTGAVVYLFAIVYILASITFYRYLINQDSLKHPWLMSVLMFLIALLAGNSSENNSAAAILLVFIITLSKYFSVKKANRNEASFRSFIKPYMVGAFLGYLAGYLTLILSPGTWNRAASIAEDDYTGFVGLLSHIYKIMVSIKELFLPELIILTVILTTLIVTKRFNSFSEFISNAGVLYIIGAIGGSFVLAVITPPVNRAYFGASVFLIIAGISLLQEIRNADAVKYSVVAVVCLIFTFSYLENLVNLARIYRETDEQITIMEQAVSNGTIDYVEVPKLHEDFDNKYTIAYFPQIDEDPSFWINTFYEGWYGIDSIVAVPRDIWNEEH